MVLPTRIITTTQAGFDTWLRQLAHETGYQLDVKTSREIWRYTVKKDSEDLAEIETWPPNSDKLRVRISRLKSEYREIDLARNSEMGIPEGAKASIVAEGFMEAFNACWQSDFCESPPEDHFGRFVAWVFEDTSTGKDGLPSLPIEATHPAAGGAEGARQLLPGLLTSNNLPPITNPTTERVWKAIEADPTLSDVAIGKQLNLTRETVNGHRATLIQMTYPAKRKSKRQKV